MQRRSFLAAAAAAPAAVSAAPNGRLAILGGDPIRREPFPSWPVSDATEEKALVGVLKSGRWGRGGGKTVETFEQKYAELTGAKHVLATANGTSALYTSINALGVSPGDEVIVPPYTFVATINIVLLNYALPVFVDTDIETFQIDANKIDSRITDRTSAIIPVHMAGGAANLDQILASGARRKVPVIEDACQAHLGEWKNRKLGSWGTAGCFSFQASKNLNSGEGGAVLTNDENLAERCFAFHNNGRGRRTASLDFSYRQGGANLRLTEFQAALLLSQMTRVEEQSRRREENARYLTSLLEKIPGIHPVRNYPGCTRSAWHLYMLRWDAEAFAGVKREVFLRALAAEGIRASGGYRPLNKEPFLQAAVASKAYRKLYPGKLLDEWAERNQCPVNDRLCEQAVWFTQTMLLGPRRDMDQIAEAITKIQAQASELRKV
jgi:dTDP-4-amino-4,6-dideoxygalactose transaminase